MAFRNREEDKLERREEQQRREQGVPAAQGEKPKKTWKEVDAQRDGARKSGAGGNDRGAPRGKPESAGYRNYKSKLDKLFEGKLTMDAPVEVDVVRSQEAPKPAPSPIVFDAKPLTPREKLKAAEAEDDILACAHALLADGGLPLDPELLLKALLLSDASLYLPALEALMDAMEKGRPKNAKLLVARIDTLLPTLSGLVADTAKGIRSRIG